jgi:hypothetical protein
VDRLALLLLVQLHGKVDRLLSGQSREEHRTMKISEAIKTLGDKADRVTADDALILKRLAEVVESGQTLSAEDEAEVARIAGGLDADADASEGVLNPPPPPPADGTPVDEGNPA